MPSFPKLRFKSSSKQQYNVLSKSVYVLTVELLDNTQLECTLTSESTGRDCMDNVCQRLGLLQSDLMGLRYVSKRRSYPKIRWVDLDRLLKKQLDKYAQDPPHLYLGVMFYVNDVSLLEDDVTRYHYFLQLKLDVVEGRLRCNYEQAIVLASYSLQAEFGDHEPEKHTVEYLQDFPLLPKPMINQFDNRIGALNEAIITQHASLRGIAQQLAEVYYVVGAQQLDGYGQECFLAKDEAGNEVLIGASLTGIVIRKGNGQSPSFFRWNDITNLVNHKRFFGIECQNYEYSVQFIFDEAESAKYVWKMCVMQHSFFKQHSSAVDESNELNITLDHYDDNGRLSRRVGQPQAPADFPPSKPPQQQPSQPAKLPSSTNLNEMSYASSSFLSAARSVNDLVDHSKIHFHPLDLNKTVPGYRRVPDYETAVKNKLYIAQGSNNNNNNSQSGGGYPLYNNQIYTSQPTLIMDTLPSSNPVTTASASTTSPNNNAKSSNRQFFIQQFPFEETQHHLHHPHHALQPQHYIMQQQYSSTPELSVNPSSIHQSTQQFPLNSSTQEQIVAELQRLNLYKPPPPYPYSSNNVRMASNSTPDLASGLMYQQQQIPGVVSGSSPDLVSRRNLGLHYNKDIHKYGNRRQSFSGRSTKEEEEEPIYQNQQQIRQQLSTEEPIYQNLPIIPFEDEKEEKAETKDNKEEADEEIHIDNTVNSGHSHRIGGITNSRENLSLEPAHVKTSSYDESHQRRIDMSGDSFFSNSINNSNQQHHHHSNKPRAGRKRWGLNFGNKSGSLKSIKSEGKGTGDRSTGGRLRPSMLAAFHGLTRSRPDLLSSSEEQNPPPLRFASPSKMEKEEIGPYLEGKLSGEEVLREFETIPKKRDSSSFFAATLPENLSRNRFEHVLPYDDNRVKISPSKDNKAGYINASHVSATLGDKQRFYIAAQGPTPETVTHFWEMIFQFDVRLLVMLTDSRTSVQYWPVKTGSVLELKDFRLYKRSSSDSESYVTSTLELLHLPTKVKRTLWHSQYTDWSERGIPNDPTKYVEFLEEIEALRTHAAADETSRAKNSNSPVLVHCSAGVGRTGVTILCDILLYCVDRNIHVDIPKILAHLRHQRMLMVQTVAQYRFVHTLLIKYLKQSRLI